MTLSKSLLIPESIGINILIIDTGRLITWADTCVSQLKEQAKDLYDKLNNSGILEKIDKHDY